jgi:hypothetical protein
MTVSPKYAEVSLQLARSVADTYWMLVIDVYGKVWPKRAKLNRPIQRVRRRFIARGLIILKR